MKLKNTLGIVVGAAIAASTMPAMAQSAGSVEVEAFAKRYFTDSYRDMSDGTLVGGGIGTFLTDDVLLKAQYVLTFPAVSATRKSTASPAVPMTAPPWLWPVLASKTT